MKKVFEMDIAKRAEIKAILEADPYGAVSFARNGYKTKDGADVGADSSKFYLCLKSEDEKFFSFAKEKLGALAVEAKQEIAQKVIVKIDEEEAGAEVGMGEIFG